MGNKNDLYEEQVVSKEEEEEYAKSINILFFETSAKDHECIANLFNDISIEYLKRNNERNKLIEQNLIEESNDDLYTRDSIQIQKKIEKKNNCC